MIINDHFKTIKSDHFKTITDHFKIIINDFESETDY